MLTLRFVGIPVLLCVLGISSVGVADVGAQLVDRSTISLASTHNAAAAAEACAESRKIKIAFAAVDEDGQAILSERMDRVSPLILHAALDKASTAAGVGVSTKSLEQAVNHDHVELLSLRELVSVAGGVPLVVAGRVVGAIGVSGGESLDDEACVTAAVQALALSK
jgi:glc operon protein GlcG